VLKFSGWFVYRTMRGGESRAVAGRRRFDSKTKRHNGTIWSNCPAALP